MYSKYDLKVIAMKFNEFFKCGYVCWVLVMVTCLVSCATIPGVKRISVPELQPPVKCRVGGLEDAIQEAARNEGALHLFLVHGMANHPFGKLKKLGVRNYADLMAKIDRGDIDEKVLIDLIKKEQFNPLVDNLAKSLGVVPIESSCSQSPPLVWLRDPKGLMGYQMRSEYVGPWKDGRQRKLVVHINCWAFTVIPFKERLVELDDYDERNLFRLNKLVKDGIITWGLMDAALYVGGERLRMQDAVAEGLRLVGKEDLNKGKFAFGAASLGSIITLETFKREAKGLNPKLTAAFLTGEQPLYLFANQIPLLGPANGGALKRGETEDGRHGIVAPVANALQAFAESAKAANEALEYPKLTVVAFNDPADLLGYPVPMIEKRDGKNAVEVTVVNVATRNQGLGIWFAGVNPVSAHTGFAKTRDVVKIMSKGIEKKELLPDPSSTDQSRSQPDMAGSTR